MPGMLLFDVEYLRYCTDLQFVFFILVVYMQLSTTLVGRELAELLPYFTLDRCPCLQKVTNYHSVLFINTICNIASAASIHAVLETILNQT